ncbi:hypothetical protein DL98DRAFT_397612, partial [Cadophora sp. DSE1049]
GAIGTCIAKSGILKRFYNIKREDVKKDIIPWGTFYTELIKDELINMFAWKDNALVLFISIADNSKEKVEVLRKRP